jgi:hypothetical protein
VKWRLSLSQEQIVFALAVLLFAIFSILLPGFLTEGKTPFHGEVLPPPDA